jgi:hypothetical protein
VGQSEESSLAVKVLKVLAFGKSLPGSLDYALAIRQPNSSVLVPFSHTRWQCFFILLWKQFCTFGKSLSGYLDYALAIRQPNSTKFSSLCLKFLSQVMGAVTV